ncbi:MAG: hypothetical protein ACRCRU_11560, partial [Vibrio sp.]|uniref:hypothetical protein n=1 Tax=Vibrio sp. TaxID=678 RepID=UPI003F2E5BCE
MIISSVSVREFFNLNVSGNELTVLATKSDSLSLKDISRLEKTLASTNNKEKIDGARYLLSLARPSSCYTPFPRSCNNSDKKPTSEMIDRLMSEPLVQSMFNGMRDLEKYKDDALLNVGATMKTVPLAEVADELSV